MQTTIVMNLYSALLLCALPFVVWVITIIVNYIIHDRLELRITRLECLLDTKNIEDRLYAIEKTLLDNDIAEAIDTHALRNAHPHIPPATFDSEGGFSNN